MSHSIHMLSNQIDTKILKLVDQLQVNNIKLSFFASLMKGCLIDAARLLELLAMRG